MTQNKQLRLRISIGSAKYKTLKYIPHCNVKLKPCQQNKNNIYKYLRILKYQ